MSARIASDPLPQFLVYRAIAAALEEDLGPAGDITTLATIDAEARAKVAIVAREPGRIAGLQFAEAAIKTFDHGADFEVTADDGASVSAGETVATISGEVRALLTGERVGLNYLGHLSGIATLTASYVEAIKGTGARICCTPQNHARSACLREIRGAQGRRRKSSLLAV